ncbi:MAG: RIP metalloprotease RseP [Deltaproteobacteria bacterium]
MIIFLLILSILILVHELGHFLTAKRFGIRVEKFSLGFGPKLLSRKIGDTEYMLCAIPFGGFIKMAGDNSLEATGARDEFLSRPPGQRAAVVFAGPAFNYILAFFSLWCVFVFGYPKMTSAIGELVDGMPAAKAGLAVGDRIVAVNGEEVSYWEDVTRRIHAAKGQQLDLAVARGEKRFDLVLTPEAKEVETLWGKKVEVGLIGIKPSDDIVLVRYGFFDAFRRAGTTLVSLTVKTLAAIFYIVAGTLSFRESVTGPLGIFFITSNAAKIGFSAVVHVIGILSMSLAIFNVLPLPVLDGGHIFLAGLEKLRGRPLPQRAEEIITNVGLSLLIVLAVFIFFNDLIRYGYWDKFLSMFAK